MAQTDSITPSLAGRVWLKSVRYPMLNQEVTVGDYGDIERPERAGIFPVAGRSTPVAAVDIRGVRRWALDLMTEDAVADRKLELALMASDVLFLHAPATEVPGLEGNTLLPGSMHAVAGPLGKHRLGGVTRFHRYLLPLTEVAPPGPDVVGTTLTWGTVMRLFGSWEALIAAHPTWNDLLATVGSGEDLVVI